MSGERLLTAEELAERWQCSGRKSIYGMIERGLIPPGAYVRLGPKKLRFRLEGIKEFEQAGGIDGQTDA